MQKRILQIRFSRTRCLRKNGARPQKYIIARTILNDNGEWRGGKQYPALRAAINTANTDASGRY